MKLQETRQKIAYLGKMLFDRKLTDTAGGNISARVDDFICITPRYSGSKYRWEIKPEQVLVADLEGKLIEGEGEISREAKAHFALLNEFSDGRAVVHAHARNVLAFCVARMEILPVLECTEKFGTIQVADYAPAHSDELAENVVRLVRGQEARIKKQAAAVIARWHGLFVLGKDLDAAFDAAERIDLNAQLIMMQTALGNPRIEDITRDLRADLAKFQ
jgi:L-fuculose-phosphate aldolase